ncbi:hypothetical protein ACX80S_17490 [Arthrobacter sp. RHLT1-20]
MTFIDSIMRVVPHLGARLVPSVGIQPFLPERVIQGGPESIPLSGM